MPLLRFVQVRLQPGMSGLSCSRAKPVAALRVCLYQTVDERPGG